MENAVAAHRALIMRFDFYNGIDGATLRLEAESTHEIASLRQVFDDLKADKLKSAELVRFFGNPSAAVSRIEIRGVDRRPFDSAEVTSTREGVFSWQADAIDLGRYSGLIDGLFAQPEVHGYQLLTSPDPNGITVELTAAPANPVSR